MNKDFFEKLGQFGAHHVEMLILAFLSNRLTFISVYPRLDFGVSERFLLYKKMRRKW
jgi:hypothetical protein